MYDKEKSCILHNIHEPCLNWNRVGWMDFVITAWVGTSYPNFGMGTPSFMCNSWECERQMWRVSVMSKGFWWPDLVHWFLLVRVSPGVFCNFQYFCFSLSGSSLVFFDLGLQLFFLSLLCISNCVCHWLGVVSSLVSPFPFLIAACYK